MTAVSDAAPGAPSREDERVPRLQVRELNVWFDPPRGVAEPVHAVRGVDFELSAGERFGLVGESGCGKTTTMLALMGLLPPSAEVSGQVLLDGHDVLLGGEKGFIPRRWTEIAMIFQGAQSAFIPVKTIGWQLAEPIRLHEDVSRRAAEARVTDLLTRVGLPPHAAQRYPHELSGGMRQRAGIAMALACEPRVLLADEPTTALDVMVQAQILNLLYELTTELGIALVFVTHDLPVVAQLCDSAAVMHEGQIIEKAPIAELVAAPREAYTRTLFASAPSLFTVPSRVAASIGTEAILAVDNLVTQYPMRRPLADVLARRPRRAVRAVDGVSLSVAPGELLAIVGESGCGKTSTVQTVLGQVEPTAGTVRFAEHDFSALSSREQRPIRRRIQMIYQDPYEALDPRLRVRDIVGEPLRVHHVGKADRLPRVLATLARVGLNPPEAFAQRYPHELSGGQRQRVAIAAGLVLGPEVLIADEPVSMLDVSLRAGILELLDDLRHTDELGVVLVTHDLASAAHYADRIAVMYLGRVVEEGPAADVIGAPAHPYTRALLAVAPDLGRPGQRGEVLAGEPPDASAIPSGCRFHPRCPIAVDRCRTIDPVLEPVDRPEHRAACILLTTTGTRA
jgi:peptide/nickel transport system ATP-binding protein